MGGVGAPPVCRSGVQNNATSRLIMGYCSMKNNQRDFEPCTLDEAAEALNYVAGDMRNVWLSMGYALKHEFGDVAFDVWDNWSAGFDGYNKKQIRTDWKAIKSTGSSRKGEIGILFKEAIRNGYRRKPVDDDTRARLAAETAQRQIEREKERRIEEEKDRKLAAFAAYAAKDIIGRCKPVGNSPYLGLKKVNGYGVLFPRSPMIYCVDTQLMMTELVARDDERNEFWARVRGWTDAQKDIIKFVSIGAGSLVIPMVDTSGEVQNVQVIFSAGAKKFLPGGRKVGCWHLIGTVDDVLIITEGYATGASLFEATGLPVAVAFDAGNLIPVAQSLRGLYPSALFLFAADNDAETAAAGKGNPGIDKANEAAKLVGGAVVPADFSVMEQVA